MAKIYGINGKITGKVGNTVFAVDGGIQVARQYNPIVANPRTALQVSQRQRVALAGQISKAIPFVAIEGLGGNKRQRRSALLSNLIKDAVKTSASSEGFVKMVAANAIRFSKGDVVLPDVNMAVTCSSDGNRTITANLTLTPKSPATSLPAGKRLRVIFLYVPEQALQVGNDVICSVYDVETEAVATQGVTDIVTVPVLAEEYYIFGYVVPLELVNEGALTNGYIAAIDNGNAIGLPASLVTTGAYKYGNSFYVGSKQVISA